ncbi:MAG: NAD-dependent epimerase/dehydratase family protein [Candidatus Eremiobacteraeota bacterium]|nr:NAD-dependent epimerase/dehydratase family protein [Candidatus Eremiobacteraeota bacterium]
MRLLVIGGTRFVGRQFAEIARDAGHDVTVFHRGSTEAPAGVREVLGDRGGDLSALPRDVDAVLDTCAYRASDVHRLAPALLERGVHRYALVSSVSVYRPETPLWFESAPLLPPLEDDAEVTGQTYGPMKVACERAAEEHFGRDALLLRPGLIVGRYDRSDRFGYWPRRFARPGRILAPGDGSQQVRFIDVRDLARFVLLALEQGCRGAFNASGPPEPLRFDAFLELVAHGSQREIEWVDESFLLAHDVGPWIELPLWEGPNAALSRVRSDRAMEAGLTYTPVPETIAAAAQWEAERASASSANLTPEKEAAVLAAWDAERAARR